MVSTHWAFRNISVHKIWPIIFIRLKDHFKISSPLHQNIILKIKNNADFLLIQNIHWSEAFQTVDYTVYSHVYAVPIYLRTGYDLWAGWLTEGSHDLHPHMTVEQQERLSYSRCWFLITLCCCSKEKKCCVGFCQFVQHGSGGCPSQATQKPPCWRSNIWENVWVHS